MEPITEQITIEQPIQQDTTDKTSDTIDKTSDKQRIFVFNKYYIDLLKKIKTIAKEASKDTECAKKIIKSIKKNYSTMDKLSNEYLEFLESNKFFDNIDLDIINYNKNGSTDIDKSFLDKELYKDISISNLINLTKSSILLKYYICILDIFHTPDIPVETIIETIKTFSSISDFSKIENKNIVSKLEVLKQLTYKIRSSDPDSDPSSKQTNSSSVDPMKEIEDTVLGKFAKDIMKDIDLEALQKSMQDPNANLFDPNGGFGKVINKVGTTMLNKLNSGELQKDTLVKDAINLATKIPNIIPGMGSQLSNIGEMLKKMDQATKENTNGTSSSDFQVPKDFNQMENLMESLMGMMNLNKTQKNAATSKMSHSMRKAKASDRLKKKIEKRRKELGN
jgi:hypothetical protein